MSCAGDEHSARAVRTNLSAMAFKRGACGAVATTSIPQVVKTATSGWVHFLVTMRRCQRAATFPG